MHSSLSVYATHTRIAAIENLHALIESVRATHPTANHQNYIYARSFNSDFGFTLWRSLFHFLSPRAATRRALLLKLRGG